MEQAFHDGWTSLRDKQFRTAADAFARAARIDPDAPLAEDARYWLAVARARAGQTRRAAAAMRDFLSRHPFSDRAGEVSVMLGWIELRAGDSDHAEAHFRAAVDDDRSDVRASARAGLDALAR